MPELFIGGRWQNARAGGRREIRCPADGSLVAEIDEAGPEDTQDAIAAASDAFDDGPWPWTSSRERGELLLRVADLLQRDKAAMARMESLDTGKRFVESECDIDDVTSVFRHFGQVIAEEEHDPTFQGPARAVRPVRVGDLNPDLGRPGPDLPEAGDPPGTPPYGQRAETVSGRFAGHGRNLPRLAAVGC